MIKTGGANPVTEYRNYTLQSSTGFKRTYVRDFPLKTIGGATAAKVQKAT